MGLIDLANGQRNGAILAQAGASLTDLSRARFRWLWIGLLGGAVITLAGSLALQTALAVTVAGLIGGRLVATAPGPDRFDIRVRVRGAWRRELVPVALAVLLVMFVLGGFDKLSRHEFTAAAIPAALLISLMALAVAILRWLKTHRDDISPATPRSSCPQSRSA
jgi:hypothetical protein